MGHERVGVLPKTKPWKGIVKQITSFSGADVDASAIASTTLTEARVVGWGDFRQKYNQVRPHSALGGLPPPEYLQCVRSKIKQNRSANGEQLYSAWPRK
jgi:hypothetical protein